MPYDRVTLVFDDEANSLGGVALELVRAGIDSLYANDENETDLLARQERDRVAAVLVPSALVLERLPFIVKRLGLPPAAIVPVGSRPTGPILAALREQGIRWTHWVDEPDREVPLRFAVAAAMSETDPTELRYGLRVPVSLDATLVRGPLERPCHVRDLSGGGAAVELDPPVPVGARVVLHLDLPDQAEAETLRLPCRVVWSTERLHERDDLRPGIGLSFQEEADAPSLRSYLSAELERLQL